MSTVVAGDRISTPTGISQFAPPPYSHNWASERGFTVVRWILGLLLITTAVMKLTGGSGEILRVALPFVSPRIYASGVVFELILGLWLISGVARAWSWLISLLFFGLLGYMSFRLGWFGQASCGCFGKIAVNPWWAFGIDVAAVVALAVWRPRQTDFQIGKTIGPLLGAAAILLIAFGIYAARIGSPIAAFYRLRGEPLAINPGVIDLGSGQSGQFGTVQLELTNYSNQPIRIVGGTSNCSCVTTEQLPLSIPPGETRSMSIHVRFTGSPGSFRRRYVLYADTDRLEIMPVFVSGHVIP